MKVVATALLLFLSSATPAKVAVGQWSYGLAASGGSVWVGGLGSGDVLRLDARTGRVVGRIAAGPRIFNLAVGGGAVWAVSNAASTLTRIDPSTGKSTTTAVGAQPYDVEWGFGSAWVANAGDGTVWRVTDGKVVKKLRIGVEPNGLTAYRGYVWATDHTLGKLVRIDPRTNRITASLDVPGADWVTGVGDALFVSQETNRVSRISLRTLKVAGSVPVGRNPLGSALVGHELWVPCIDAGDVDVVDPGTLRVVARKRVGPSPIVVLPAYGRVWISHAVASYVSRL